MPGNEDNAAGTRFSPPTVFIPVNPTYYKDKKTGNFDFFVDLTEEACYNDTNRLGLVQKGMSAVNDHKKPTAFLGLLNDVLGLAQATVQFWGPLVAGGIAYFCRVPWYAVIGIIAAALLLIVFLFQKQRQALMVRIHGLLQRAVSPAQFWEHWDKVAEYTYLDRETLTFQVNYSVKFLSGSHKRIPDKCKWTAGEIDDISAVSNGQKIVLIPESEKDDIQAQLSYQDFFIEFPKVYTKRDPPLSTGYCCKNLHDPERKAKTCLVIGIYRKTNQLTMRVRFAASLKNIVHIRKLKYADYLDDEPYECIPGELEWDEDRQFRFVEFTIEHPIQGGKYAIDWEFQG